MGWPTAMDMASRGNEVCVVDNYLRRDMARQTNSLPLFDTPDLKTRTEIFLANTGKNIDVRILDCSNFESIKDLVRNFQPETIIHYAEQPSAPYSMASFDNASLTLFNNLSTTFNVIWACIEEAPDCHIVKLGTMGEYGTPNIDIEEGWINIEHNGRNDKFLFPRQAGSLYHTTKILDTDLLWFYVRTHNLRVTDLMQGPVYGLETPETNINKDLMPHFHYDDLFGTVFNRFLVQAVAGIPLTVFGKGGQTRGYLNLLDTLQCVSLASSNPAKKGELRILNQFTETLSVTMIAEMISKVGKDLGLNVKTQYIDNPRKEQESHYYNPKFSGLSELGLSPTYLSDEIIASMIECVLKHKENIDESIIMPRVQWN